MSKTVAIVQSNYIPWKGYFHLIDLADEFILYDDVQYTRRDWRNRNRIKTQQGVQWLTIPVQVKGKYSQRIADTLAGDPDWPRVHWRTLAHSYSRAPHFGRYSELFESLYLSMSESHLSRINFLFIREVCQLLGIETKLSWSSDYQLVDGKTERLVELCRQAGASDYLSGPAARDYLDESQFAAVGIRVRWMEYSGYREYPQVYPPFEHGVSVLDLLFNTGPDAAKYMRTAA